MMTDKKVPMLGLNFISLLQVSVDERVPLGLRKDYKIFLGCLGRILRI